MKIFLIALPSLLGLCLCDKPTSSYAVLPYGNEIQPLQSQYPQPNYYSYYDENDEKKKYTFGRIMRAPFKALKGAGNYMMGMFDDVRSRFLELNGSFLRAKGDFLKASGENLIRQAYKGYPQKNYYEGETYYSYQSPSALEYNPNPKPVYHYITSEEDSLQKNEIDDLGLSVDAYKEVSNDIGTTYNEVPDDFTPVEKSDDVSSGFSRRKNEFTVDNVKKFKNFNPSERDFSLRNIERKRDFALQNIDSRRPYPLTTLTKSQPLEFIKQRSAKDHPETQRTQRSYHVVGGGYDFGRPIPVPVPIAVNPAQLVFPSVQDLNPVIGY